ncbi:hypothetical protein [Xanthomonas sp. 1678]|uniref:hypothetical protein n=1 Tax=Xanthomonas sp. 1678 TaxID=3158788 RepID=UPI00285D9143|nr:hypothetical protein [Xanthomonas translucens]
MKIGEEYYGAWALRGGAGTPKACAWTLDIPVGRRFRQRLAVSWRPVAMRAVSRYRSAAMPGAVSIGGARYSMGGQIGAAGSLHLHLHLRELVGLVSAAALVAAPPLLRTGSAAPACAVRSHLQGRSCVSGSRCGSSPS